MTGRVTANGVSGLWPFHNLLGVKIQGVTYKHENKHAMKTILLLSYRCFTVAPGQAYLLDYINELIISKLNPFVVPNNAFISKMFESNSIADWTMRTRDAPYMENRISRPISTWRRWWET